MAAASKTAPTKESSGGSLWEADPLPVGEGRRYGGSNEQEHSVSHRGRGPDIQARSRGDNVGKAPLSAKTGNNLQRSAKRGQDRSRRKRVGLAREPVRSRKKG